MAVEVVILGDKELVVKFAGAPEIVAQEVYAAMLDSTLMVEAEAKALVPKRTGALAKSIQGKVHRYPEEWQGTIEVGGNAPYGPFVEFGTGLFGEYHRPYPAMAVGNYPSQRVPPKPPPRVETHYLHPGMKPRPYVRPALAVSHPKIRDRFNLAGHRIAERLS